MAPSGARRFGFLLPWALFLGLLLLPLGDPSANTVRLLFTTAVWIVSGIGWNLVGGLTGQVSFGFAVFYGLGAYVTALMINAGRSPYFAFLGGIAIAVLASFLVGMPTFRLRGPYFAIATIGVGEATRVIMNNLDITGGASGYRVVEKRAFNQIEHYYCAIVLMAIALVVSSLIVRSKFGLALRAIKQDEDAAAALGVNPFLSKLWIHAVGAALTGVAGGLYARYHAFIYPGDVFAFQTSIYILLIPVIGGIGTVWGPVLGGIIFGVVEEELVVKFPNFHLLLYGSILILIVLLEPDGLLGLLHRLRRLFRRKRDDSGGTEPDQVLWGRSRLEGREL
ncbi:MAG TPA: branched-chain amino acid ABC transporter permease [Candidatus Acidoferrales bacterium]|jgi:branched-chain amino acid transport system permease protein|nr:branched-chain amino acid ABC transporter permease [Candidatus Acidoferrales bacterium]